MQTYLEDEEGLQDLLEDHEGVRRDVDVGDVGAWGREGGREGGMEGGREG